MTSTSLPKNKQKKIEELIEKGRKQSYLTVSDISDLIPNSQFDQDQIDQITKIITDLKIKVVDSSKEAVSEPILNDDEISDDVGLGGNVITDIYKTKPENDKEPC